LQSLPWKESEISAIDLGDLPCRLTGSSLLLALQKIWLIGADDAVVKLRIPHPRHDMFLMDLGYIRALLPETLTQLDPRHSTTGLHHQLGVRFDTLQVLSILDSHWQKAMDEKNLNEADINLISKQASNVIEWIEMQLQIKKSLWVQAGSTAIDGAMRKQLQEQMQAHLTNGNEAAAAVIRQFLESAQVKA